MLLVPFRPHARQRATRSAQTLQVRYACVAEALWSVTALQGAHDSPPAPLLRATHHLARQALHIIELQGESAEGIASEGIEAGGDEDEVRREA